MHFSLIYAKINKDYNFYYKHRAWSVMAATLNRELGFVTPSAEDWTLS